MSTIDERIDRACDWVLNGSPNFDRLIMASDVYAMRDEISRLRNLVGRGKEVLEHHEDEGPYGEGWKSEELQSLISDMKDATER